MSGSENTQQCRARTEDGERCSREAVDGKFCHQHDESDPTIDDGDDGGEGEAQANSGGSEGGETSAPDGATDVLEVRDTVESVAPELIGYPLDGVVEITQPDDGWTAVVEVIERRSVPNTQDILGRYEITLDDADSVSGYRRTGRHRRSDTGDEMRG